MGAEDGMQCRRSERRSVVFPLDRELGKEWHSFEESEEGE
jgi:hypothetical protein